tara:strand:+ start:966 stop:1232 length:267 start_codon:yes stop_codon:yes gene_type:complete
MRNYTIKIIIAAVALYILFKLTIGAILNTYISKIDTLTSETYRIEFKEKVLSEMKKGSERENYFTKNEQIIISNFINKIVNELKINIK